MEVMYMNAGDKNIAVRKVYAKADGIAYVESTFKTKLTQMNWKTLSIKEW